MTTSAMADRRAPSSNDWRPLALVVASLPLLAWFAWLPRYPQPLGYHDFADQRLLLGLPHFWNVVSNLPFAVVGLAGLWWLLRDRAAPRSPAFAEGTERMAYFVFFAGEFLTCFGSGYYHAGPSNATLLWDRLAFSLMLTSCFTIVITEFVSARAGRVMLAPMTLLGLFSVLQWGWSESLGRGDVRLYLVVQFYPVLAMPFILAFFRSRYTHAWIFAVMWALYAAAKVAEVYDTPIFAWTAVWSGHTVKHLVAAAASCLPLHALRHRRVRSGLSVREARRVR